jgi:transposase
VAGIEEIERSREDTEERMREYLKEVPYSRYMLSIEGIGEVTVAGLIGEVGDFTKYKTAAEITKLAGLDLFEVSSGKHKGERHISKRGRPLMRKLLFYAAIITVQKGRIMHERYERYIQRAFLISFCRPYKFITMYYRSFPLIYKEALCLCVCSINCLI